MQNPFKMWGSWVGAGIGVVLLYTTKFSIGTIIAKILGYVSGEGVNSICISSQNLLCGNPAIITLPLIMIISGLLIGWGIHSLIKKLW